MNSDSWSYSLSEDEFLSLQNHYQPAAKTRYSDRLFQDYVTLCSAPKILSESLGMMISNFAHKGNEHGFFIIQNIPVDDTYMDTKPSSFSELSLLTIALSAGKPMGHLSHKQGQIIQDLYPKQTDASKQLGSSADELYFHTEDAHMKFNCDIVGLICIRGDTYANTLITNINYHHLDSGTIDELSKSNFTIKSDESFDVDEQLRTSIITQEVDGIRIRFDPLFTQYHTHRAQEAAQKLDTYVISNASSVNLKRGEILLIDNRKAVHGRSKFTPRYDGTDRWIQRAKIYTNARSIPSQYLFNSHVMQS